MNIIIALNPTHAREIRRISHPITQTWPLVVGPLADSYWFRNPPAYTVQASYFPLRSRCSVVFSALALFLGENIYFLFTALYIPGPGLLLGLWLFWITFTATAILVPTNAVPTPTTFLLLRLLLLPLLCLLPLLLWGSYGAISMREGWVPYVWFTVLFVWVVLSAFGERICFDFGCAISWVFEHHNLHIN